MRASIPFSERFLRYTSADARPRARAGARLRVLSYNVGMLPPRPGRTKAELRRAAEICNRILDADPGYDIVCLQEVNDGWRKVLAGVTTLEEVLRVTSEDEA